jgi:hypothetical protein
MKSILSRRHQLALALTLFLGLPGASYGAAITVPQGLNPGDTYRIIFMTSTVLDTQSSNIADYNRSSPARPVWMRGWRAWPRHGRPSPPRRP